MSSSSSVSLSEAVAAAADAGAGTAADETAAVGAAPAPAAAPAPPVMAAGDVRDRSDGAPPYNEPLGSSEEKGCDNGAAGSNEDGGPTDTAEPGAEPGMEADADDGVKDEYGSGRDGKRDRPP